MRNIPSWIRLTLFSSLLVAVLAACNPYLLSIVSFDAQPTAITAGQQTTLSWELTWTADGPLPLPDPSFTAVITPGDVDVTDQTSLVVFPTQTTTYTLAATNAQNRRVVTSEVTVTVTPINTGPVADDQSVSTPEDTPLAITLTGSDVDGDSLTFTVTSGPTNGSLSGTTPNLDYTPDAGFVGDDGFTFVVNDGSVNSGPATVSITVTGMNDTPEATDDAYSTAEDTVLTVPAPGVLDNDSDQDGDPLTAILATGPSNGSLTLNADGSFTYTPNADFDGSDSFGYQASDGVEDSNVATVTITVDPVNDPPAITSDGGGATASVTVLEDTTAVTDVEATDPEGDTEGAGLSYGLTGGADQALFSLDAGTGVLTFTAAPDFENPTDADTDNDYEVQVTVTDSGLLTDVQDLTVTVANIAQLPVITSDGGGASAAVDVAENTTVVTDVEATDPDGDTEGAGLSYSLTGGADLGAFTIDADTGVLTFLAAPDFENPADTDTDNDYQVQVTVTDSSGLTDVQDLTVSVTGVDEAPAITSSASVTTPENETAVTDVEATDPEGETEGAGLSYSLTGGADQGFFVLDASTGVLTFLVGQDFENPADADTDGVYEVEVTVTDSGGASDSQLILVSVNDGGEAPEITSDGGGDSAGVTAAENQTAVTDVEATDPDGDTEGAGLSYSLTGGADQALFTIDAASGVLTFLAAPDFENPADADTDGDYEVQVTVTDSGLLTDVQDLTVTVTDVNEAPAITSAATVDAAENQTVAADVDTLDPEGETEGGGLNYSLTGGTDQGFFAIDANTGVLTFLAAPDFENPGDADTNNVYRVRVTVTDSGGLSDAQTLSVTVTDVDEAPAISSDGGGATAAVNAAENQTAVTDVEAADPEGETEGGGGLSYSLTGGADQGDFSLDTNSGVLTFSAAPDFENPGDADTDNDYEVQVTVTDSGGLTDVQDLTVTVTNVNEPPEITSNGGGATASTGVPENTTAVTDVQATDPEGDTEGGGGLTYSLTTVAGRGIDNGLFTLNPSTGLLTFTTAPDFETPADDDGDNDYEVQVTVTDSGPGTPLTDLQDITVSVTDVAENQAPVLAPTTFNAAFVENGGAVTVASTITVDDGNDANLASATVTITNLQDSGLEVLAATPSGSIGAGEIAYAAPTLTITPAGGAPLADFQAVLRSVTYQNTSQTPTESPDRSLDLVVNDGTDASNTAVATVSVTADNDPPTLTAPGPYASTGNVGLIVPAGSGLLTAATITDPDFAGPFTVGGTVPTSTSNGGTVSITTSTGAFTYSPSAGFTGADTFDYQVCDNGTPLPSECSTAKTVTINVSNLIWFLDNTLGAAGNGTLATPFNTLAGFEAVNGTGGTNPGAGDCIFVATGSGNYTGGVTLKNTQILVGEGAAANLDSVCGITLPANSTSLPTTGGTDPTITNTGGNGIGLAAGNTVRGLTVGNTSGTGISGSSFGTLTLSDTTIGGSGKALDLNTGTMNAVTFDSVTVTSSSTGGISLQSLSGTTTFSSLSLTTTGGTGFLASSGGTLNLGGTSSTINSTNGSGIDIANTTIGAGGMTFASVSSSGGANVGIRLDTTGTSGGLTVNGGTIANKTGANGSTTSGIGIFLNQTSDPSFSNMQLNDFSNFAIRGVDVVDFSLSNSTINGTNGSSAAADEGSVSFDNLTGGASFTTNSISGGHEDNIVVTNTSGTLNRMTVSGGTIGLNSTASGNDGILVESQNASTLNLTVSGVTFLGSRGDHIQANALDTSSQDVIIQDNTFTNTHPSPLGSGVTISGGSATANPTVTYNVSGTTPGAQTFRDAVVASITVNFVAGAGSVSGTIQNNAIGVSGVAGSGGADGIFVGSNGTVTHTTLIDNNTIVEPDNLAGIDILANAASTMNATVTNNSVTQLGGFSLAALYTIVGGATLSDTASLCADVRNNTFDASAVFGFDIFVDQISGSASYRFPGYGGGATGGAALDAFLAGQNTLVQPLVDTSFAQNVSGTGTTCP